MCSYTCVARITERVAQHPVNARKRHATSEPRMSYIATLWQFTNKSGEQLILLVCCAFCFFSSHEKKEKRVSLLRELLSEHRELQSKNTTITPTIKGEHKGDYTVSFFTSLRHCTKQNLLLWEYKYSVVANGAMTSRRPSVTALRL